MPPPSPHTHTPPITIPTPYTATPNLHHHPPFANYKIKLVGTLEKNINDMSRNWFIKSHLSLIENK